MRLTLIPLVASLAACSASFELKAADYDDGFIDSGFSFPSDPGSDPDDFGGTPSETEDDGLFLAPAQTDVHIFVVNPDRDTVTRIHVDTLDVVTTTVGDRPTRVEITPDYATAVVFNQGDDSVTLLDALSLDATVVPVRDNLNTMRLSPDGSWAVRWHDLGAVDPDDGPPSAVASYNEVSLVQLATGTHTPLVVGFNPKDVTFTPDGAVALAVADTSLAVIRLDGDAPTPEFIPIADPLDAPPAEEVEVSPDGSWAFLRQRAVDALTIVDLTNRTVDRVAVGTDPTDLDLTADGTQAVVISRAARQLTSFDTSDPLAAPRVVDLPGTEPFGAIELGLDDQAILYTTATAVGRYAVWDTVTDDIRILPLAKPVAALARTPEGNALLVAHDARNNDDGSTPEQYADRPALSLVDLDDFRANTLRLAQPIEAFANATSGRSGYAILEDTPLLTILDYPTLSFESLPLRSVPTHLGVLPDLDPADGVEPFAWVSQEHPLGRISFYDPADPQLETVTGFELNAAIED